jgi:hypothetical protein
MRTPAAPGGAGYGWWTDEIEGHPFFEHSGGHVGYLATIGGIPDLKLGVVVMTNSFNPIWGGQDTMDLVRTIHRTLIPALIDLKRYAGTYAVAGGFAEMRVDLADGKLWFTVAGSPAPRQEALGSGAPLKFHTSEDGSVDSLSFALFRFIRKR